MSYLDNHYGLWGITKIKWWLLNENYDQKINCKKNSTQSWIQCINLSFLSCLSVLSFFCSPHCFFVFFVVIFFCLFCLFDLFCLFCCCPFCPFVLLSFLSFCFFCYFVFLYSTVQYSMVQYSTVTGEVDGVRGWLTPYSTPCVVSVWQVLLVWWHNVELTFCSKKCRKITFLKPLFGALPKIGDWIQKYVQIRHGFPFLKWCETS